MVVSHCSLAFNKNRGGVGRMIRERLVHDVMAIERVTPRLTIVKLLLGAKVAELYQCMSHKVGDHER